MSARTTRTTRTRLLAASAIVLTALSLTACGNGNGVRDEGSSAPARPSAGSDGPAAGAGTTAKPAGTGTTTGSGSGSANGSKSSGTTTGGTGTNGKGSAGGSGGSTGKTGTGTRNVACDASNTRTSATAVSRPLNHLLLTVTNTGSRNCDLTGYPIARFGEAQSVPPVAEETHPQAVVTLAPGESGYAGVLLSSADGSGSNGYTAKTLEVGFGKSRGVTTALPAKGVYVDDKLTVTYWQQTLDAALSY
ncbi:DUF4232 domain-containing protein [Streptomyces sp. NPDC002667]|uniref:DUF4232 domain-containing protein n=1 Tax=Streptomyces sp. NPDC002667 TaxID=3364657 RepID=UPI0036C28B91